MTFYLPDITKIGSKSVEDDCSMSYLETIIDEIEKDENLDNKVDVEIYDKVIRISQYKYIPVYMEFNKIRLVDDILTVSNDNFMLSFTLYYE